jgi:hypothetical protein
MTALDVSSDSIQAISLVPVQRLWRRRRWRLRKVVRQMSPSGPPIDNARKTD